MPLELHVSSLSQRAMHTPKHILVVDDDPFSLKVIADFLADQGYVLHCFSVPLEAWADLQAQAPGYYDLILLDRIIPGMDGLALLRQIKADARYRQTPVVMQTAAASPDAVREGIAAGAFYYLAKPYSGRVLLAIVHSALAMRAAARNEWLEEDSGEPEGIFEIADIDDAHCLADRLAAMCPHPERVAVGLAELFINAIEHGNLGIGYAEKTALRLADAWEDEIERRLAAPDHAHKRALVKVGRRNQRLIITVRDCGDGFAWHEYLDIDPARAFDPNGRGIAIARQMSFDSLEYRGNGNIAVVTIRLDESAPC